MSESVTVYLGLGSNVGDRESNLDTAVSRLSRHLNIEKTSSIYDTEPVGNRRQGRFLNLVLRARTTLAPRALLELAKQIEGELGRKPAPPNSPRPIDIDILLYDDRVVREPDLTIPHPRMRERAFVLTPLAEVAPEARDPVTGRSARELLSLLKDRHDIRKWEPNEREQCTK